MRLRESSILSPEAQKNLALMPFWILEADLLITVGLM